MEALTLGTLGVIVVFGLVGYWFGTAVRRQTVNVPLEAEGAPAVT